MREVTSRTFYCPKTGKMVTLVEYARCDPGCEAVCGILSCSHQDMCVSVNEESGEKISPWGQCPACRDRSSKE